MKIKNYQWNSIWADIFEIWVLTWEYIEKLKNKIKKIIFKK